MNSKTKNNLSFGPEKLHKKRTCQCPTHMYNKIPLQLRSQALKNIVSKKYITFHHLPYGIRNIIHTQNIPTPALGTPSFGDLWVKLGKSTIINIG